ncbi:MAG: hypothetical protein FWG68_12170 [Defluviitaleaceae bacterium]|nr:hypothetical protein [Defluviitaleaceae bacterium]
MLDLSSRKYIECQKEDKAACVPVIDEIMRLADVARREGVLALEEEGEKAEIPLLKAGIRLVVDGTDPELVQKILETNILTTGKTGADLLTQLIVCNGVLSIQQGENPTIILAKMFAFLGEDYMDVLAEKLENHQKEHMKIVNQYAINMPPTETGANTPFEEILEKMSKRDIQLVLRDVDNRTIALALKGASPALREHILDNFSARAASNVLLLMDAIGPALVSDVEKAQNSVLETVKKFEDTGEIINVKLLETQQTIRF